MGRPVPPLARSGTVRRRRSTDDMAAGGQRGGSDLADGSVLPGSRPVPTDHSVRRFAAGLGLARSQWPDHVGARHSGAGAMAGLGALGDRPIRWNRADLLRRRLDRAGARPTVATLVSGNQMRRRELLGLLGSATAWPLAARAQQAERKRRIGLLMAHAESDAEFHDYLSAFRDGLQKLGWTDGRNIQIESRWGALDDEEARQRSAKELIALQPEVILTQNTPPTASMLEQTRTIPVVFVVVADPVGSGFVQSLARPGANATGLTVMEPTIAGKWPELLKEIAPRV